MFQKFTQRFSGLIVLLVAICGSFTVNAQLSAGALNFDGSNDHVNVSNVTILNQLPLTIEAWVRPELRTDGTNLNQYYNNVISNDLTSNYGTGFGVVVLGSSSGITVAYNDGMRYLSTALTAGTWYHVSVVYTPGNVKTYLNGNLLDNFNFTQNNTPSNTLIRIGKYNDDVNQGTRRFFKGDIDEVRIWNRALCQGEIQNNMNCEVALPQTGLYSYYKFNVGLIGVLNSLFNTLPDNSGNSNDGTLTNFSLLSATSNWVAGKANGTCNSFTVPQATITAGSPTVLCQGDSVLLTANSGNSYQWYNYGTAIQGQTAQTYYAKQTGQYTVVVTTGNCAITSAVTNITVNTLPSIFINSSSTTVCSGIPVALSVSGNNNAGNAVSVNSGTTGGYVSIPHQSQLSSSQFTMEAWVRPTQNATATAIIMKQPASGSGQNGYGFRRNAANRFEFFIGNAGNEVVAQSTILSTGPWYQLTGTYDGTTARIYVNGVLRGSATVSATINSTTPIIIGNNSSFSSPFTGTVDELRIWNVARTATEISCDYKNAIDPANTSLVGYWPMNTAANGFSPDITSYQNHGAVMSNASLTTSSATVGNIYKWLPGPGISNLNSACLTITPGATTSYKATATNAAGCTVKDSITVTVFPSGQIFSVTGGGIYCAGGQPTPINLSGSEVGISYQLKKGADNIGGLVQGIGGPMTIGTVTEAGNYTVVAINNNCTNTMSGSATVTVRPSPSISLNSITNVTCNGATTGAININVSGGTPSYFYSWSNNATIQNLNNIGAGNYMVTVTDNFGCTDKDTFAVTEPTPVVGSAAVGSVSCFGGNNGSISLTMGGTAPYIYSWSNGAITKDITNLAAGNYSVAVTDAAGCTVNKIYIVNQPSTLTISGVITNAACSGGNTGSIDLSVSGGTAPYTYNWSNSTTNQDPTNLATGTYTVTVTDANGCTGAATYTIGQAIYITGIVTKTVCGDSIGAIDVSVTGGTGVYTYSWTNGANTQDISGVPAGLYTLAVTDGNGCTNSAAFTVSDSATLTAISSVANIKCNGAATGAININVAGGFPPYTYLWNDNATSQNRTQLNAGQYSVVITDSRGCNITRMFTVTQPAVLTASNVVQNATCNGLSDGGTINDGSINITPLGGNMPYSFAWSNNATTEDITSLGAGTYTLVLQDSNGCKYYDTFSVTEPPVITIAANVTNITCNNSTATIATTLTGGLAPYSVSWSTNDTTNTISGLSPDVYFITVTDVNGCVKEDFYDILDPEPLDVNAQVETLVCIGDSTGTIDLFITGGAAPFTYQWAMGDTTSMVSGLPEGSYDVTVTDANGCTFTNSFLISAPDPILVLPLITDLLCYGGNDGAIELFVEGGVDPYSYSWSTNDTTESITGLAAGTYQVTITDANGCVTTATETVSEPDSLIANVSGVNVLCNGTATGAVDLTVSGGMEPYAYSWSNNATAEDLSNLNAGTYSVTVTDDYGCIATASQTITQPATMVASVTANNVSCNGGNTGAIDLTVVGGVAPYTYSWSNSATTEDISNLSPGNYTVTITDANGCVTTAGTTITQPTTIFAAASATNITCNGANNGAVNLTVSGGNAPYTYTWSNNANIEDLAGLGAGNYSVTIIDANGCPATASATVTEPAAITLSATTINAGCNNPVGAVTLAVSGGIAPYTYLWSNNATSQSLVNIAPGTYGVVVTDASGCTKTGSYTVGSSDTSAPFITGPTSGTTVTQNPLAPALNFNVFVRNNASFASSQSNGPVALGGNLTLAGNYTVAANSAGTFTVGSTPIGLVVGGQVNYVSGNSLQVNQNSYIKIGNCTGSYTWYVDQNNAYSPIRITNGMNYNGSPRINLQANAQQLGVSATSNPVCQSNVIDFVSAFGQLQSSSVSMSAMTVNANLTNANGNPIPHTNLPGQVKINLNNGINVLNVSGTDLNNVQSFTFNNQPSASRVLIVNVNAPGSFNWNVYNSGGIGNTNSPYILYNFYNTTALTVQGNGSVMGSLFAPYANISKPGSQNISGQVVGQSFTQGGGAILYDKFDATLTTGSTTTIAQNSNNIRYTNINTCTYTVSGNEFTPTATDNCGTPALSYTLTGATSGSGTNLTGVTLNKGITAINWAATDGTYTSTYTFNITVTDTVKPVIITKNISVTLDGNGNATITPQAIDNGSSDNCGTVSFSASQVNFNTTNIGTNNVTLTVTDNSGNISTGTAVVTVLDNAPPTVITKNITVALDANGNASIVASQVDNGSYDAGGILSMSVSPSSFTVANIGANTVTLTVTDNGNNSATGTAIVTVIDNTVPFITCPVNTIASCDTTPAQTGLAVAADNSGSVTLSYSDVVTGNTITRTWKATDASNNQATCTQTITIQNLAVVASATNVSCNGGNTGSISLTVTGIAPFTYSWSNNATTKDIAGLAAGTYTVTVTDGKGCIKTETVVIAQPSVLQASAVATNATCNISNGAVNLTVAGGTAPYTYAWTNNASTEDITGLAGGTYSVVVTDAKGCSVTESAVVNQNISSMVIAGAVNNVSCYGSSNGAVDVSINNGTAPYSYSWSHGATTQDITGRAAGIYTVTVTDATGCSASQTFTITQPVQLSLSSLIAHVNCKGADNGGIDLTVVGGTGPYTYSWNTGNNNNNNTNWNWWNWWSWWSNNNNNNSNNTTTQDLTGLEGGTYTVIVTDAEGCTATGSYIVTEPTAALTVSSSETNISCHNGNNGSITLNVSGGTSPYIYNWSNSATTQTLSGLTAGNYSVTVTDAKGCTKTASISIAQPNSGININGNITHVSCKGGNNGAVNVSVSGGNYPYSYSWSHGATSQDISGRVAGTYTVTVTDDNGCTASKTFVVTEPATALGITASTVNVNCNGGDNGSIDLTVTGGTGPYTYNWNLGGGSSYNCWNWWWWWCNNNCNNNYNSNSSQDVSGLEAGNYSVTVTDSRGCTVTGSYTITQPTAITVTGTKTNVTCKNGNNGAIALNVSGGTSPYSYSWSNNATTQNIGNLTDGNYTVTVTDAKGCTKTASFSISEPSTGINVSGTVTNVSCNGGNNGAVNVSVTGGSSPYSYSWSHGATSQDISGRTDGTYTITVTDNNGCSASKAFTIAEPNVLNGSISVSPIVTVTNGQSYTIYKGYGPQSVTLSATASGGTAGYNYNWSPATGLSNKYSANPTASPNSTTTYTVTITDSKGCTKTVSRVIKVVDATCGNNDNKVIVCHNGNEICVSSNAVAAHLAHGCYVGPCGGGNAKGNSVENTDDKTGDEKNGIQDAMAKNINVYPNPTTGVFTLQLPAGINHGQVLITDMAGKLIEKRVAIGVNTIQFNLGHVAQGSYLIHVTCGTETYRSRITIQ